MTTPFVSDLDTVLLKLNSTDTMSLRDAANGIHCFGSIGSGKTSGLGKAIAGAYLRAGMGGIVGIVKPEEKDAWVAYAKQNGREHDLLVFEDGQGLNFLEYIFAQGGVDGATRAVDTLLSIIDSSDKAAGGGGSKKGEEFWQQSARNCLLYAVAALWGATGTVRMSDLTRFIDSAPLSKPTSEEQQKALKESNFTVNMLDRMQKHPVRPVAPDLKLASITYWLHQYPNMSAPTRASVVATTTAKLGRFNTGRLRKAFCDKTTILPEMTFAGKIILLNFPCLTLHEEGIISQHLFALLWMKAVEGRNALPKQFRDRPVFYYCDESQFHIQNYLDIFLSTCRASKACVCFLTQAIPTYYGQVGKDKSDVVDGFVGKFNTKIFFLNSCPKTNQYAAELIGKGFKVRMNTTESESENLSTKRDGSVASTSHGWNKNRNKQKSVSEQQYETFLLPPNYFATALKNGAARNNCEVTAVLFKAGAQFAEPIPDTSNNVLLATFKQT
jgi:hypothetical protein